MTTQYVLHPADTRFLTQTFDLNGPGVITHLAANKPLTYCDLIIGGDSLVHWKTLLDTPCFIPSGALKYMDVYLQCTVDRHDYDLQLTVTREEREFTPERFEVDLIPGTRCVFAAGMGGSPN
jgi:hypothetical protein